MKKSLLVTLSLLLMAVSSFAQGIYLRAGSGYGMPAATTDIGENYLYRVVYSNLGPTTEYSSESVSASYGAGSNFNFAVGYKFNENFILDLNFIYNAGRKYETSYIYEYIDIGFTTTSKDIYTTRSSGLFFNPTFIFSAGFGKQAPYGRFGILAGSPTLIRDEYSYDDGDGVMETEDRWELGKGLAIGFQTAIGMNWKITDRLDIYSEMNFVSMTYYAKEGNLTRHIYNGEDQLDQLDLYNKKILYEKKFEPTDYDPNSPAVETREATPFSYVSAQVGVRFTIFNFKED